MKKKKTADEPPLTITEMQRRATLSRWRNVSKAERSAIMRRVINARWNKSPEKPE